jgi:hypothetical protein
MVQIPRANEGFICPLHKVDVSTVCHRCPWWTRVIGKNPQSEAIIDDWQCAVALLPMLLVENAQQSRGTGAAVETLRNELVAGMNRAANIALSVDDDRRLLDAGNNRR